MYAQLIKRLEEDINAISETIENFYLSYSDISSKVFFLVPREVDKFNHHLLQISLVPTTRITYFLFPIMNNSRMNQPEAMVYEQDDNVDPPNTSPLHGNCSASMVIAWHLSHSNGLIHGVLPDVPVRLIFIPPRLKFPSTTFTHVMVSYAQHHVHSCDGILCRQFFKNLFEPCVGLR